MPNNTNSLLLQALSMIGAYQDYLKLIKPVDLTYSDGHVEQNIKIAEHFLGEYFIILDLLKDSDINMKPYFIVSSILQIYDENMWKQCGDNKGGRAKYFEHCETLAPKMRNDYSDAINIGGLYDFFLKYEHQICITDIEYLKMKLKALDNHILALVAQNQPEK